MGFTFRCRRFVTRGCLLLLGVLAIGRARAATDYPRVRASIPDPGQMNELRRFHSLLSRPANDLVSPIRIIVFGEAGTWGDWPSLLETNLVRRFPGRRFEFRNHSLPLMPLDRLQRAAESEVYPWLPDLVILHARGSQFDYSKLVRRMRSQTSSDILLITDPPSVGDDLAEETSRKVLDPMGRFPRIEPKFWLAWYNYSFLPTMARERRVAVADIRTPWKQYMVANKVKEDDLWANGLLLRPHGDHVFERLLFPWLEPPAGLIPVDPWVNEKVKTLRPGRDGVWKNDTLSVEFIGTTVELVASASSPHPISVWIDGRKPLDGPESVRYLRSNYLPGTAMPGVITLGSAAPNPPQTWIATVNSLHENPPGFEFRLHGFVTGDDGVGDSRKDFISNSGQVVIQAGDWSLSWLHEKHGNTYKPGDVIVWNTSQVGCNEWIPAKSAGTNAVKWVAITAAQGLAPGKHVLTLKANPQGAAALREVRAYRPPELPEKER